MYLWPAYIRLWNGMNSRIRFWQNWEFFSSVSWQTFELIKTRSCGVQTPTYPTDFHHRWWRLRHTKVRASTKAAGWGFHSEVRVLCEVLGCGFLHLRNLHEELILGSNIVVGSRCSCVAGGVRIILVSEQGFVQVLLIFIFRHYCYFGNQYYPRSSFWFFEVSFIGLRVVLNFCFWFEFVGVLLESILVFQFWIVVRLFIWL